MHRLTTLSFTYSFSLPSPQSPTTRVAPTWTRQRCGATIGSSSTNWQRRSLRRRSASPEAATWAKDDEGPHRTYSVVHLTCYVHSAHAMFLRYIYGHDWGVRDIYYRGNHYVNALLCKEISCELCWLPTWFMPLYLYLKQPNLWHSDITLNIVCDNQFDKYLFYIYIGPML